MTYTEEDFREFFKTFCEKPSGITIFGTLNKKGMLWAVQSCQAEEVPFRLYLGGDEHQMIFDPAPGVVISIPVKKIISTSDEASKTSPKSPADA